MSEKFYSITKYYGVWKKKSFSYDKFFVKKLEYLEEKFNVVMLNCGYSNVINNVFNKNYFSKLNLV